MSNYPNVAPNYYSGRLAEHISATYADSEAAWHFPDHGSFDVPTPSPYHISPLSAPKQEQNLTSHLHAPSTYSGINSPLSLPSRKSGHTRRRGPDHIPRPRNAFIFFRSAYISSTRASAKDQQNELSKRAGMLWNAMSPEEKRPFCELAALEKEQHYAKYPDYVYSPGLKASPKPTSPRRVNSQPKSQEKQRKMKAFDEVQYCAEKMPMAEREPPSPFHPHLDPVTGQFAYQQYTYDFMYTSMPPLPQTSSPHNSTTPSASHHLSPYSRSQAPSSLLCDNPYPSADYLTLLSNSSVSDDYFASDLLLQQYTNELTKHSEMTIQSTEYVDWQYHDQAVSCHRFFDFTMSA